MEKRQRKKRAAPKKEKEPRKKTPTFLVELPLRTDEGQAKRIRSHLEAGRQLYNAILSEGQRRLVRLRASKEWQEARAIPQTQKAERRTAFSALRTQYGFSDYALQAVALTDGTPQTKLRLVESKTLSFGSLALTYQPDKQ